MNLDLREAKRIVKHHEDVQLLEEKIKDWNQYRSDLTNDDTLLKFNTLMSGIYPIRNEYNPPQHTGGNLKISTKLKLDIISEQIELLENELKTLNEQL